MQTFSTRGFRGADALTEALADLVRREQGQNKQESERESLVAACLFRREFCRRNKKDREWSFWEEAHYILSANIKKKKLNARERAKWLTLKNHEQPRLVQQVHERLMDILEGPSLMGYMRLSKGYSPL